MGILTQHKQQCWDNKTTTITEPVQEQVQMYRTASVKVIMLPGNLGNNRISTKDLEWSKMFKGRRSNLPLSYFEEPIVTKHVALLFAVFATKSNILNKRF